MLSNYVVLKYVNFCIVWSYIQLYLYIFSQYFMSYFMFTVEIIIKCKQLYFHICYFNLLLFSLPFSLCWLVPHCHFELIWFFPPLASFQSFIHEWDWVNVLTFKPYLLKALPFKLYIYWSHDHILITERITLLSCSNFFLGLFAPLPPPNLNLRFFWQFIFARWY